MCRVARTDLAVSRQAPALARAWASETLARWSLRTEVDRVLLVLNELVTNSVVHAGRPPQATLSVDAGVLEVLVRDGGPGPGRRALRHAQQPDPEAWEDAGGRGLQIVAAVSDRWGATLPGGGAAVWARWRLANGWPYVAACVCGSDEDAAGLPAVTTGAVTTAVAMPGPWDDAARRGEWFGT